MSSKSTNPDLPRPYADNLLWCTQVIQIRCSFSCYTVIHVYIINQNDGIRFVAWQIGRAVCPSASEMLMELNLLKVLRQSLNLKWQLVSHKTKKKFRYSRLVYFCCFKSNMKGLKNTKYLSYALKLQITASSDMEKEISFFRS